MEDDLMSKLQAVLSDEESMNQIKQLASMLGNSTENSNNNNNNSPQGGSMPDFSSILQGLSGGNPSGGNNSSEQGPGFDMGTLLQLQGLFKSVSSNDKNSQLLLALKPHLREDKQEKIGKAIKILKLMSLWTVIKESDMLKSFDLF